MDNLESRVLDFVVKHRYESLNNIDSEIDVDDPGKDCTVKCVVGVVLAVHQSK